MALISKHGWLLCVPAHRPRICLVGLLQAVHFVARVLSRDDVGLAWRSCNSSVIIPD